MLYTSLWIRKKSGKETDSAITVSIHSDSRQALRHLAEGPALQDERIGCNILEKLIAVTERNTVNAVQLIWVPGHAEGSDWTDKVAIR